MLIVSSTSHVHILEEKKIYFSNTGPVPKCILQRPSWVGILDVHFTMKYRLYGLVVRVLGYGSGGPGSIPGTTRKESTGSGTGSTQPREYN
jgi:hypothetical protein